MKTRVLIVEDDPMAQRLMELFVQGCDRYELVKSIESADTAIAFCSQCPVDLILTDICTAMEASGLHAAGCIKKAYPKVKIIIVTSQSEVDYIGRAREAGADSFWYKAADEEELIFLMDKTMEGQAIFPDATPALRIGPAKTRSLRPASLRC